MAGKTNESRLQVLGMPVPPAQKSSILLAAGDTVIINILQLLEGLPENFRDAFVESSIYKRATNE